MSNPNLPSDAEYKAFDDYLHISGIIDDRVALKKAVKEKWKTKDAFFGYFDWADKESSKKTTFRRCLRDKHHPMRSYSS